MMAIQKDVAKLCDDALKTGRGAFTYARYLRVNLVYASPKDEGPAPRATFEWTIAAVVMDDPMKALLGDDESTKVGIRLLCSMIEEHLGDGLKFSAPERAPVIAPDMPLTWIVRSSGGPKAKGSTQIDVDACERIVRYARRDGRGTVTSSGWQFRLHKLGGATYEWILEITPVDRGPDETRESISAKHYDLGQIQTTITRLLRAPVRVVRVET